MLDIFTVSFFGHRRIEDFRQVEKQLDELVRRLIREKEYVDFLIGRNGEFDQFVSSAVRRAKRDIDKLEQLPDTRSPVYDRQIR
jgi:hypothetical protein